MNFFENQEEARRKTRWIILLFIPAVIGLVAVVDITFGMSYLWLSVTHHHYSLSDIPRWLLLWCTGCTLTAVIGQTLYTIYKLRDGGNALADAFDARWVDPNTQDLKERQLLNVVEEMAIASGVRVPMVYILDVEYGLNAFSAGHSVSDAIIAVTQGLLNKLDRDELQGVIGHEFSHILNGDMALNMRMMGLLAGIVGLGSIGSSMLRLTSSRDFSSLPLAMLLSVTATGVLAIVLLILGYTGLFFARLIKSAISREREFLADASSVQFTRNPGGIAGSLEKMRTVYAGTLIQNRHAEDASHMFFAQSYKSLFSGLFPTHPPLEERIERILPGFSLAYKVRERIAARTAETKPGTTAQPQTQAKPQPPLPGVNIPAMPGGMAGGMLGGVAGAAVIAGGEKVAVKAQPGQMANMAGATGQVETVQRQLAALPDKLRERVRQTDDACAIVLALMLAPKDEVRNAQLAAVKAAGLESLAGAAAALEPLTRQVAPAMRFPLIDLALPAIKRAAPGLRNGLLKALEAVINADRRMSPHEFVVLVLMRFQAGDIPLTHAVKYNSLDEVREDVQWLLSLVAYAGCGATSETERQKEFDTAFAAGVAQMKLENAVPAARNTFNQQTALAALGRLRQLAPLKKSVLIQGLFASVMADGKILVIEAELMRMVGAVLDCPLPPLLEQGETSNA